MKLSIITVNLNNRDGLQKTIDSVVSQTFKDFEWIVIDGGSTDGSKELIEQNADHFAYWVSEPDTGIYNAMNKGITVAKGEYLQFLNSGDKLYEPNILERLMSTNMVADIIYGDCLVIAPSGEKTLVTFSDSLPLHQLLEASICHPSSAIRRELLVDEPYDETLKIVSDWKFFLRKAMEGRTFHHIGLTISIFYNTGVSATNKTVVQSEREKVIHEEVPSIILNDNLIICRQNMLLQNWQVRDVLQYSQKRPLYHKIITAALSLIKFLDGETNDRTQETKK